MASEALKPCPFCGSRNVAQGASRGYISVWCFCGARGPDVAFPENCDPLPPIQECHAAWNRRAPAPDQAGETFAIEHDGFIGTVQGGYVTREGRRGIVLQQLGTRVVHVYGEKWLTPASSPRKEGSGDA